MTDGAGRVLLRADVPASLESLLESADERADRAFASWKVPGLVYGVLADGDLIHARSLGTLRVGEDAPPGLDSVFRIASMTKSFTAAVVLLLRDEGRLALDDPAERYVPELAGLRYPTADSPRITIRHLLTMTAGLPTDDPWGDRQQGLDLGLFSELLHGGVSFAWVPGVRFEYSNLGYGILGRVITNIAGREYREVVRERLLEPLGMTSTGYLAEEVPADRLAHGYVWRDDAFVEEPIDGYGALAAMGGVFTSIADLARWVAGFQAAWPPRGEDHDDHPLSRASRREMQARMVPATNATAQASPDATPDLEVVAYGLGLYSMDRLGVGATVGHGGGYPGFGSHMRWHPASGFGVIGMGNGRYAPVTLLVREILADLVAGTTPRTRTPAPADATAAAKAEVEGLLESWDDAAAAGLFAMNVELDEPVERRRAAMARLRQSHGRLRVDDELPSRSDTPLHLEWWLRGERGRVRAEIRLSPELPARVQTLNLTSVPDPPPELVEAAEAIAGALAVRDGRAPTLPDVVVLDGGVDRTAIERAMRASEARFGELRLGPAISGDGDGAATFQLRGERGDLELTVARDLGSGALTRIELVIPKRILAELG